MLVGGSDPAAGTKLVQCKLVAFSRDLVLGVQDIQDLLVNGKCCQERKGTSSGQHSMRLGRVGRAEGQGAARWAGRWEGKDKQPRHRQRNVNDRGGLHVGSPIEVTECVLRP